MAFNPSEFDQFTYHHWQYEPRDGLMSMHYSLGDIEFTETLGFPPGETPHRASFSQAATLLFLTCGLSYYKLAAPKYIEIEMPVTPQAKAYLQNLIHYGLGEFAFRNDLGALLPEISSFHIDPEPSHSKLDDGILIPVGGGKDSIVTIEASRAMGLPIKLLSVRGFEPISRTAQVAELPLTTIDRRLDPRMIDLSKETGLRGHVPATAMISLISICAALHLGIRSVVMSNERSASEGNTDLDGITVNHQYSKSAHYENGLRELLRDTVNEDLEWFSLLRPFSELSIAKKFSGLTQYHDVFLSCNRAFTIDSNARASTWCGTCPKCVFVYLVLANFINRDRLNEIFHSAVLDNPDNRTIVEELCGFTGHKPFECVGEQQECRAALAALTTNANWRDDYIVKALSARPELNDAPSLESLTQRGDASMIPQAWKVALDEVG